MLEPSAIYVLQIKWIVALASEALMVRPHDQKALFTMRYTLLICSESLNCYIVNMHEDAPLLCFDIITYGLIDLKSKLADNSKMLTS